MTDDLVQFLRARLADDERAARRAGDSFRQIGETGVIVATEGNRAEECASANWAGVAEHIVRHDPARVLAEVDAKRRLLIVHKRDDRYSFSGCITCDAGDNSCGCMGGSAYDYPCETLRVLALPYADHPDYREEWKL